MFEETKWSEHERLRRVELQQLAEEAAKSTAFNYEMAANAFDPWGPSQLNPVDFSGD